MSEDLFICLNCSNLKMLWSLHSWRRFLVTIFVYDACVCTSVHSSPFVIDAGPFLASKMSPEECAIVSVEINNSLQAAFSRIFRSPLLVSILDSKCIQVRTLITLFFCLKLFWHLSSYRVYICRCSAGSHSSFTGANFIFWYQIHICIFDFP